MEHDQSPVRLLLSLCAVGFFVNCQPSEPFLTRYLMDDKGLTEDDLDNLVWPMDTYASLALMLPVGLLAEYGSYHYTILLGLLCRMATRLLLLFGRGVGAMRLMQCFYAAAVGTETIAYFALPYVVLMDKPHLFASATVAVRGACYLGNALGSGIGQCLVSFYGGDDDDGIPLRTLFYLSLAFTTAGLFCFPLLPPVVVTREQNKQGEMGGRSGENGADGSVLSPDLRVSIDPLQHSGVISESSRLEKARWRGPMSVLKYLSELYFAAGLEHDAAFRSHRPANSSVASRERRRWGRVFKWLHKQGRLSFQSKASNMEEIALTDCSLSTSSDNDASRGANKISYVSLSSSRSPSLSSASKQPETNTRSIAGIFCSDLPYVMRSRLSAWTIWWVIGTATNQIFSNYYQNILYASSRQAPGGLVELLMGVVSVAASTLTVSPNNGKTSGNWLFRNHLALLTSTCVIWAALVTFLTVLGPWPPPLALACVLCILVDAIFAFQLAAGAVIIATDVLALSSCGMMVGHSQPPNRAEVQSSQLEMTDGFNVTAVKVNEGMVSTSNNNADGGGQEDALHAARIHYEEDANRKLNNGNQHHLDTVPRYAIVFTVASLGGLCIASLTQWLCAIIAASINSGIQTRGHFAIAALQEVLVLPLVLLPHSEIFCCFYNRVSSRNLPSTGEAEAAEQKTLSDVADHKKNSANAKPDVCGGKNCAAHEPSII